MTNPNWLEPQQWKWAQDHLPILCADVLPLKVTNNTITQIGLIHRDTPHQGRRWCLVGGRLYRNESLAEAATRQLHETLGQKIKFKIEPDPQPTYVAQYFTTQREVGLLDPRQHAVALVLAIPIEGQITPQGEAHTFNWFPTSALPKPEEFGFGQDQVVRACLNHLKNADNPQTGTPV